MQMVLQGVSTRRVKKITTELCGREFSRQTVSNLTQRLDEQVQAWAKRPLEEEYPFLLADAMQLNIRHHEAVRSAMALIVVGISEDGYRETLGLKIALRETAESWKELLEEPFGRGSWPPATRMKALSRLFGRASLGASGKDVRRTSGET